MTVLSIVTTVLSYPTDPPYNVTSPGLERALLSFGAAFVRAWLLFVHAHSTLVLAKRTLVVSTQERQDWG
jgi:hypothetical protein